MTFLPGPRLLEYVESRWNSTEEKIIDESYTVKSEKFIFWTGSRQYLHKFLGKKIKSDGGEDEDLQENFVSMYSDAYGRQDYTETI